MMEDSKNNQSPGRIKQIATRLDKLFFQPRVNVTNERDRLRAYVSSIVLFVVSLVYLYGLSRYEYGAPVAAGAPSWWTLAISALLALSGYVLSRTKYYQWGVGLVFVPIVVILYGAVFNPPSNFADAETLLRWSILPLLLGGILLPRRAFFLLSLIIVAEPITLIFVLPPEMTQDAVSMTAFITFNALLLGLLVHFQAQLETQALAVLQVQNLAEKEGIIAQLEVAEAAQARRAQVLETSSAVNRTLATILEPKQLISAVVNQIQQEFHYYYVQLYLLDESGENLVVAGGTGEAGQVLHAQKHRIPVGKGLVGEAAANNRHVLVDDVALIGTWLSNPLLPDTQAELAVPIAASNTVLGVLDVQQDRKNAFTEEDVALLQSVAASVAIALQNARLYEQAQTQAEYEAQLNKMNQQLVGVTNMDQMLQVAAQQLGELSGVRRATVQLSRRQNGRMQEKS